MTAPEAPKAQSPANTDAEVRRHLEEANEAVEVVLLLGAEVINVELMALADVLSDGPAMECHARGLPTAVFDWVRREVICRVAIAYAWQHGVRVRGDGRDDAYLIAEAITALSLRPASEQTAALVASATWTTWW